jgi:hypothetical protein
MWPSPCNLGPPERSSGCPRPRASKRDERAAHDAEVEPPTFIIQGHLPPRTGMAWSSRGAACLVAFIALSACALAADAGPFPHRPCVSPAPLDRAKEGGIADEWIVTLHASVEDLDAEVDALAERHGFTVTSRLFLARAFAATLPEATLATVRCEPSVERVTQNRTMRALAR